MKRGIAHKNEREQWIELLRIISMFWIIAFHFSDHGTIDMVTTPLCLNWVILAFSRLGGGIGNCLFVLISGYLLYNKKFRISHVITLWAEVEFYSLISYILSTALGIVSWQGLTDLAKNIFPIIGKNYWFISSYLVMYFLSPFLNHFIRNADYKRHMSNILILLCCFSLPQLIPHVRWMASEGKIEMFVLLYITGALIKKYDLFNSEKQKLVTIIMVMLFVLVISEIVIKIFSPKHFTYFVWPMSKITIFVIAVLIFGALKGVKVKMTPWLQCCSQSVFGVYLIHIGRMEKWFFEKMFDISGIYTKGTLHFTFILICYLFAVFALCVIIDQLRLFCVERPLKPILYRLSNWCEKRYDSLQSIIMEEFV